MRWDNKHLYRAIAEEDLILHDIVIINNGKCRRIRKESEIISASAIYSVIDIEVKAGQKARLSGKDTVFYISED